MHLTPQPLTQLMQPFNHQDTEDLSQGLSNVPCMDKSCPTTVGRKVRVSFGRLCLQAKDCCLQAAANMYCLLGEKSVFSNKYVYSASGSERGFYYCLPLAFSNLTFLQVFNSFNTRLTGVAPVEIPPSQSGWVCSHPAIPWARPWCCTCKMKSSGISHHQHCNNHCPLRARFARETEKPINRTHLFYEWFFRKVNGQAGWARK